MQQPMQFQPPGMQHPGMQQMPAPPMHLPTPGMRPSQPPMHLPPEGRRARKQATKSERSGFTPFIVIGLIVVVAIIVTLIVAMSGPNVSSGK
jgi:hypothetical protein